MLDSYLRSCCSLTGMVLHLDLLNYGEAVDRLNDCLLLPAFLYIHFTQHGPAAVSVCSIPWLEPARVDKCSLQAQITVNLGHYLLSCSSKQQSNDTRNSPHNVSLTDRYCSGHNFENVVCTEQSTSLVTEFTNSHF